jgi:PKD repeat protein
LIIPPQVIICCKRIFGVGFCKGQSGIEYLTTYGWMIVAASVVGGTMYTQVDTDTCGPRADGFSAPFPTVEEVYQYDNGTVVLDVRNPDDSSVEVNEIVIREDGEEVGILDLNKQVNGQASEFIDTNRFKTSESCETRDIQINYDSGTLSGLTSNGTLTGRLDLVKLKALFSVNQTFPATNEQIMFNASDTDGKNSIEHYNWSFGDGNTAKGEKVTHTYSQPGLYNAELKVEDTEGIIDSETAQIFVGGLLEVGGDNISSLKVSDSLVVKCAGGNCNKVSDDDETGVDADGDEMEGTLFTNRLVIRTTDYCVTDYASEGSDEGCNRFTGNAGGKVSEENNKMYGTLKVPSVKPLQNVLCLGKNC